MLGAGRASPNTVGRLTIVAASAPTWLFNAEGMLDPFYVLRTTSPIHCNHVESATQVAKAWVAVKEMSRRSGEFQLLGLGDACSSPAEGSAASTPHFYEHQDFARQHDEIQLSRFAAVVAGHDLQPLRRKVLTGEALVVTA